MCYFFFPRFADCEPPNPNPPAFIRAYFPKEEKKREKGPDTMCLIGLNGDNNDTDTDIDKGDGDALWG